MNLDALPEIIQGGMGIGVSGWPLARAVAIQGQLGVVSGTSLDSVLIRRLQDGDLGGHVRRAMEAFPIPDVASEVLDRFFKRDGRLMRKLPESMSLRTARIASACNRPG